MSQYMHTVMTRILTPFCKLSVVFALLVAMAGTGFAHRVTPQDVDQSLQSYLAAGGTLAELCGDAEQGSHGAGQTCDACRLVDSVLLPKASQASVSGMGRPRVACHLSPTQVVATSAKETAHPVRAPPAV